jgi:hypothetical protein
MSCGTVIDIIIGIDFYFISLRQKTPLQRIIYSGFQLKTTVNGFTTVVKRKPLLSLQRLLAKNRCKGPNKYCCPSYRLSLSPTSSHHH